MSPQLANFLQIHYGKPMTNGTGMIMYSYRGTMKAKALITDRFEPLTIFGKTFHQIGIFWHWGYKGIAKGHSANRLTAHVGDANTRIPEYKAFLCHIQPL
jgi:formate dehydrogenase major subunit